MLSRTHLWSSASQIDLFQNDQLNHDGIRKTFEWMILTFTPTFSDLLFKLQSYIKDITIGNISPEIVNQLQNKKAI